MAVNGDPSRDPSAEGPDFFSQFMMKSRCYATSQTRRTAHQCLCVMHGFHSSAKELSPAASAAFCIAQPPLAPCKTH